MAILQHHYLPQGQQVMMGLPVPAMAISANRLQINPVIRHTFLAPLVGAAAVKKDVDLINQIKIFL